MQGFLQRHRNKTLHLLFWCVYFSFFFYQISNSGRARAEDQPFQQLFTNALSHTIYLMIVAYLNYFLLLPRFLRHNNGLKYSIEFMMMSVVVLFTYVIAKRWIVDGYTNDIKFYYSNRFAIGSFVTSVLVSAFVALLRFFSEWRDLENQRTQLKNEKLVAELKFLKNQINPHFLFNTLNNLYSLAYTNSPQTTEVISRLSQMMRYMVYDSNYDQVPLEKEIEYMRNYISLEKLRLNEDIPIDFEVSGEAHQKQIVPLLLIPFLENAFKHGVSNNNKSSWVKTSLNCNPDKVTLKVSNSKMKQQGTAASANSGVGLDNVRRRLDLNYPGKYTLKVDEQDVSYTAILDLQLN